MQGCHFQSGRLDVSGRWDSALRGMTDTSVVVPIVVKAQFTNEGSATVVAFLSVGTISQVGWL